MPEHVQLYLDEDTINRRLIRALRSRDIDVVTAHEAGLIAVPDQEHLEYASSMGRAVFTFNTRDFVELHTQYVSATKYHAGVIVSDQTHIGVILRRLLKLCNTRSASDMQNWLEYLSNWR